MAMRAKGTANYLTSAPNGTSRRLVDRFLALRATRLSRSSLTAYRSDLLDLACFLGRLSIVDASPEDIGAWFSARSSSRR